MTQPQGSYFHARICSQASPMTETRTNNQGDKYRVCTECQGVQIVQFTASRVRQVGQQQ